MAIWPKQTCWGALGSRSMSGFARYMEDGSIDRLGAHAKIIATGGFGRAYQSCIPARTGPGDGITMDSRAGVLTRDLEVVRSHTTGILLASWRAACTAPW